MAGSLELSGEPVGARVEGFSNGFGRQVIAAARQGEPCFLPGRRFPSFPRSDTLLRGIVMADDGQDPFQWRIGALTGVKMPAYQLSENGFRHFTADIQCLGSSFGGGLTYPLKRFAAKGFGGRRGGVVFKYPLSSAKSFFLKPSRSSSVAKEMKLLCEIAKQAVSEMTLLPP
jgi:hypothetical protein